MGSGAALATKYHFQPLRLRSPRWLREARDRAADISARGGGLPGSAGPWSWTMEVLALDSAQKSQRERERERESTPTQSGGEGSVGRNRGQKDIFKGPETALASVHICRVRSRGPGSAQLGYGRGADDRARILTAPGPVGEDSGRGAVRVTPAWQQTRSAAAGKGVKRAALSLRKCIYIYIVHTPVPKSTRPWYIDRLPSQHSHPKAKTPPNGRAYTQPETFHKHFLRQLGPAAGRRRALE